MANEKSTSSANWYHVQSTGFDRIEHKHWLIWCWHPILPIHSAKMLRTQRKSHIIITEPLTNRPGWTMEMPRHHEDLARTGLCATNHVCIYKSCVYIGMDNCSWGNCFGCPSVLQQLQIWLPKNCLRWSPAWLVFIGTVLPPLRSGVRGYCTDASHAIVPDPGLWTR